MFKSKGNMFCFILFVILLTASSLLGSQQETRVYEIGVLSGGGSESPVISGLLDGLKKAGYVLDKTLHVHFARTKTAAETQKMAEHFAAKKMDAIVAGGVAEASIAKRVTREIPIVFAPATNPIESGLVKSFANPETNLTGLSHSPDLEARKKELEVFREAVPLLRRVIVLHDTNATSPLKPSLISAIQNIASNLGLEMVTIPIRSLNQISTTLFDPFAAPTDGIFTICTNLFSGDGRTPELARDKRLPLYGCATQVIKLGALVAYTPDFYQIGRRAAWYVDRILRGTRPTDLPVESPRKLELIINLKTAAAIGIKIPPVVLQRADKVIE